MLQKSKRKMSLELTGKTASHTSSQRHIHVKAAAGTFTLEELDPSPSKISENDWDSPSRLLLSKNSSSYSHQTKIIFDCRTEADISNVVVSALRDTIFLVEQLTGKSLKLHSYVSLFAQRPDHLVVVEPTTGAPVLVEDKKPYPDGPPLTSKPACSVRF